MHGNAEVVVIYTDVCRVLLCMHERSLPASRSSSLSVAYLHIRGIDSRMENSSPGIMAL